MQMWCQSLKRETEQVQKITDQSLWPVWLAKCWSTYYFLILWVMFLLMGIPFFLTLSMVLIRGGHVKHSWSQPADSNSWRLWIFAGQCSIWCSSGICTLLFIVPFIYKWFITDNFIKSMTMLMTGDSGQRTTGQYFRSNGKSRKVTKTSWCTIRMAGYIS